MKKHSYLSSGTSSGIAPCGCSSTRLLEPEEDVWIEWKVCSKHYRGEEDDKLIVEAAKNYREWSAESKSGEKLNE